MMKILILLERLKDVFYQCNYFKNRRNSKFCYNLTDNNLLSEREIKNKKCIGEISV